MVIVQTRYEQIKELGDTFNCLIDRGFIDPCNLSRVDIYEDYLKEREHNEKPVAAQFIADKHGCSRKHVYWVIRFMNKT